MAIYIQIGISLICAVLAAATPSPTAKPKSKPTFDNYQLPLFPGYQTYTNDFGFGGKASEIPFGYSSPHLYGLTQNYYGQLPYLTGPGVSQFGGLSQFGYPSFPTQDDNLAVQIARTKASNALDKNAVIKNTPLHHIQPNTLCDTFATLNNDAIHNFYSLDNGPLVLNNGYDYNYNVAAAGTPFYTGAGTYLNDFPGNFKVIVPEDGLVQKDDKNAIDRKVKVVIPDAKPDDTIPDRKVDVTIPDEKAETPISNPEPPLNENNDVTPSNNNSGNGGSDDVNVPTTSTETASSSETTTKSGDDDENDEKDESKKKKRQSVRAIRGRKF